MPLAVFGALSKPLEPVVIRRRREGRNRGMRLRSSFAGSSVAPGTHGKTLSGSLTIPNPPPYLSWKLQFCLFYDTPLPVTSHHHPLSCCSNIMSLEISTLASAVVIAARWSALRVFGALSELPFDGCIQFPHWTLLLYLDSELLNFVSPPKLPNQTWYAHQDSVVFGSSSVIISPGR